MIIKAYTTHPKTLLSDIVIIENAQDVVVLGGSFNLSETGPVGPQAGPLQPTTWRTIDVVDTPEALGRFIDYTDAHGVRVRLRITSCAYVCSNEGRTIEKVTA